MVKRIVVLDKAGFPPTFIRGLEQELGCGVVALRELHAMMNYVDSNAVDLAVVNPWQDQGGVLPTYVDFVKNDLNRKKIPVLIFSRTGAEKMSSVANLVRGENYTLYIRKPSSFPTFVSAIKESLENEQ